MSAAASIVNRYRSLPRAAQWAIIAGALLGGYLIVDELLLKPWDRARAEAAVAQSRLEVYEQQAGAFENAESSVALGMSRMGEIAPLVTESQGAAALRRRVDEVLKAHGLEGWTVRETGGERLPAGTPPGIVGPTEVLVKVRIELNFQGPPESVMAALADLERSPIVSSVRHVRLRHERETKTLAVTLVPEVWTIGDGGGGA